MKCVGWLAPDSCHSSTVCNTLLWFVMPCEVSVSQTKHVLWCPLKGAVCENMSGEDSLRSKLMCSKLSSLIF